MSVITQQTIYLNMTPGGVMPVLHVSQGDSGLEALVFKIFQNAQPYSIPAAVTNIQLNGATPVGVFSYDANTDPAVTWSGDIITAGITQTMTAEKGITVCELRMLDAQLNSIGTLNFVLSVEPSPYTTAHVSTSDMATIVAALNGAQQYELLSKSWAVGDTGVRSGENTNNSEYWSRQSNINGERWATGEVDGTPVPSTDPAYQNSSKHWAEESDKNGERWSVGQIDGVDVPSTDPTYQNNSKYWSKVSQGWAKGGTATHPNEENDNSEYWSRQSNINGERWATGEVDGTPVPSTDDTYHNNSKYWSEISHVYANQVSYKKVYANVAEMVADTALIDGQVVRTLGYYAVNDGGGALYRIYSTVPATYYETLSNGLYAELITNVCVTPEMFGARGDGSTNDYSAFNAALNSGYPVYLLPKVYKVSSPLTISKPVIVNGTSPQRLETNRPQIDFSAINGDAITLTVPGVVFNDVNFFGNRSNTNLFSMSNIYRLTCNRCGFYEFNIALKTNRAWNTGWNNCVWEFCNKCCEFDGINTSHVFNGCNFYSSTYGIHSKQELDYSVCIGCGFDAVDKVAEFENSYANNMSFVNCGFESYITGIYCKGNSYVIVINPTLITDERSIETYKGNGQITVIGGRTDNVLTPNKKDVLYIGTVLNENAYQINASFALNERIFTPIGSGGIYDYIYPVSVGYQMKINFTAQTVFDVQIDVCSTEYPETYHFTKESSTVAKTQGTPATFTYAITANDNVTITFTKGGTIRVRAWFKYGGSIT